MTRTFEIKPGKRAEVPLLVGLFGASSSGKTYSALRIATGIQRVRGGKIVVIDTESKRALHYADSFTFDHMEFGAPFGALDYLEAIKQAVSSGARTIVIDSASHMHEGPGGMLEQHSAAVERMSGGDYRKAERVNFAAWIKPKQEFQRFKNELLQLNVALIMCFRAKSKIKPAPRGSDSREPVELGWMPIISDELTFEMTTNILLEPGSDGVPTWKPEQPESRARVKLPRQFREYFERKRGPLDEADGEMLARWAAGDTVARPTASAPRSERRSDPPTGIVTPAFRSTIEWDGAPDWSDRPLEAAPLDALNAYRDAVARFSENRKLRDHVRDAVRAHLRDVDEAIAAKEPVDVGGDEPGRGDENAAQ